MQVVKRDGSREDVSFDKVLLRIRKCAESLDVNPTLIAQKTLSRIHDGVKTSELDELAAQLSISLITTHPDYGTLASNIIISNHQKNTDPSFVKTMRRLANQAHEKTASPISYLSASFMEAVEEFQVELDAAIQQERDFLIDYFGFKTLERQKYLLRSASNVTLERPQHMWMRVAVALWGSWAVKMSAPVQDPIIQKDTRALAFQRILETYELLSTKQFIHATPTLFNAGSERAQMSSCYLSSMAADSITGIYKTLADCAQISKYAGGIGLHVSNIRAKGAYINGNGGSSTGIVPMLRNFNATARYVDQGSKRNGSFAIYLEPWHADLEDFLKLKLNTGSEEERARDLFYGLWIPDLFMERIETDAKWTLFCPSEAPGLADVWGPDFKALYERYESEGKGRKVVEARHLWERILVSQIETGTPYLLYKDAANGKSNQQNLGTIKSSNLCVAPETLLYTKQGIIQIKDIVDKQVEVWNGTKWSSTIIKQTGQNQSLIKVNLSNGSTIDCTPYHKFIVAESYSSNKNIKDSLRIEAKDLKPGMKLQKWKNALMQGDKQNDFKYPYTHGFFCGDGTYSNGKPVCALYGAKKLLISKLDIKSTSGQTDACERLNTVLPTDLEQKFKVPINASIECRLRWLEGILDADGCVARNGTNESLQIASINNQFLQDIRIMLMGLGVNAKVTKLFEKRQALLPDGHGNTKMFDYQELWRLLISSTGLYSLVELGLHTHRLIIAGNKPQRCAEQYIQVISIEDNGRIDNTYCFNEPENHAGVFNGILTGNCTEIIEFSSPEETAVCNLASLALPAYVNTKTKTFDFDALRRTVKVAVRNLNRVIDINFYPTPETRTSNMKHRPIGLGVQGLADVFAMLRMPWEQAAASRLNQLIFEHIYFAALEASADLAELEDPYSSFAGSPASKGQLQFDLWSVTPITQTDGLLDWASLKHRIQTKGLRNSLLVAPMPTASTSQILGFNECFEPFTSNIYTRRTLAGEYIMLNKHLVRDLLKLGLWSEDLKNQIIVRNGSVQGLDIPAALQALYKTAWEIKQKTLIDMSAARGAFVCQSQSLNLFVPDPTHKLLSSMHFYGWKKGLKTGIYYLRTKPQVMAQKFTIDPEMQRLAERSELERQEKEYGVPEGCLTCSA